MPVLTLIASAALRVAGGVPPSVTTVVFQSITASSAIASWSGTLGIPPGTFSVSLNGTTVATGLTTTNYTLTGLSESTNYTVVVTAINLAGTRTASGSFTTQPSYWIGQGNTSWSGAVQCKVFVNSSYVWASLGANGYQSWPREKWKTDGTIATSNPGIYPSSNSFVYPAGGQITRGGQHAVSGGRFAAYWTDTSNGDYWLAGGYWVGNTANGLAIQKVNDAGDNQWATRLQWTSTSYGQFMDCISKGGTTWAAGRYFPSQYSTQWSDCRAIACSFNSSGGANVIKQYGSTTAYAAEVDFVSVNNSGQPIFGITQSPYATGSSLSYPYQATVECWDSGLNNRQWGKYIWHPQGTTYTDQHTTDIVNGWYDPSTGNTYVTGYYVNYPEGPNWYRAYLVCFNSSGAVQWQKVISNPLGNATVETSGIYGDSTGVYWSCSYYDTTQQPNKPHIVIKFNTGGTYQWQRGFGRAVSTAPDIVGGSVTCVGNLMYLGGTWQVPNYAPYVVKLPNDGSLTGTYGDWRWYASGINVSDGDLQITDITSNNTSWSDQSGQFTVSQPTVVNSTLTPTVTRTLI